MKNFTALAYSYLMQPQIITVLKWLTVILLFMYSGHLFADDGTKDILDGTSDSLVKTLNGTGKKFIYLAEGILSLAMYIKTKNLLVLTGIVVVSIFFNIILHIANIQAT